MNALNTPLAELDPEVHATLRAEPHPLHPHLSGDTR